MPARSSASHEPADLPWRSQEILFFTRPPNAYVRRPIKKGTLVSTMKNSGLNFALNSSFRMSPCESKRRSLAFQVVAGWTT